MGRRVSEKIIILIYSIYALALMFASTVLGWPGWITPITSIGIVAVWIVYLRRVKNYRFRALLYSAIVLATFVLYNTQEDSFGGILSTYCAAIVVLSILDIPDIVVPEYIFSVLLVMYHLFFSRTVPMGTTQERIRSAIQILSTFAVVGITHHLIKKHWEINQKLSRTVEASKAAERGRLDFWAHVSHEFKAPASAICSSSEMILQESVPESARENAQSIQAAGRNLLSMIDDVLDYSALEVGGAGPAEAPYHLPVVVNDVINMALAYKGAKELELIVDCSAAIPNVLLGDEQKLRRVILNLVSNAIKFTDAGGVVLTLSARPEQYGVNLCVRVKDTGIGISQEQQEKLFGGLNTAEAKAGGRQGGLGLGLAISKKIITKMNGFISVKSKPGKGSEFMFVVPQKVVDPRPLAAANGTESAFAILYLNTEKAIFNEIRDDYLSSICNMMQGLGLRYHQCRNLGEIKRRVEHEGITHALISENEYLEDREFFDSLSAHIKVLLLQERGSMLVPGGGIVPLHKPFHVATLAAALNGGHAPQDGGGAGQRGRLTAPGVSVLVVDDNLMNLKAAEGLLRPYGIKVATASGGEECLQKLESMHFDMVFMDYMMPGMDGIQTVGRIRELQGGRFGQVPIIALTANVAEGAREMFLNAGFQGYIAKPIEAGQVERVLMAHIPGDRLVWEEQRGPVPGHKPGLIDREKGLAHMGGKADIYESILGVFAAEGQGAYEKLERCFAGEDWHGYSILVHSLKSNSLSIGADGLGELAKELETAAKRGDGEAVRERHAGLMQLLKEVMAEIGHAAGGAPAGEVNGDD